MRYLIQNRKEFAISVGFFVMTAINLIRAIREKDVTEEMIVAIVYAAFGVMAWWYNMPTSEENCIGTGVTRQKKREKKSGYMGDYFFADETDEEEGGVDDE